MVKVAVLGLAAVFLSLIAGSVKQKICGCRDDRDSPIVRNL